MHHVFPTINETIAAMAHWWVDIIPRTSQKWIDMYLFSIGQHYRALFLANLTFDL